jgi:hypothetical protein
VPYLETRFPSGLHQKPACLFSPATRTVRAVAVAMSATVKPTTCQVPPLFCSTVSATLPPSLDHEA